MRNYFNEYETFFFAGRRSFLHSCFLLVCVFVYVTNQLAGPQERERWKARQQQAKKRASALARLVNSNSNSNGAATEAARKAAVSNPSLARGLHFAENGGSGRPSENSLGAQGESGRRDSASRGYSNGGSGGGNNCRGAGVAEAEVVAKCQGCNEEGHEFRECPHRSDSALEGSEDDDDNSEEEEEEEQEEDEYSDDA